jgi:CheY-like chemotaxis protein
VPVAGSRLRETILVVDDDFDTRETLTELFRMAGYSVWAASSAVEGLERLKVQAFDAVVTDQHMPPGRTGAWMLNVATASNLLEETAVLMLTGSDPVEGIGRVRILSKPIEAAALLDEVATALGARAMSGSSF